MKKVKITVEASGVLPDHFARRLEGLAGKRDMKDMAQLVIQEDRDPRIEIVEIKDA